MSSKLVLFLDSIWATVTCPLPPSAVDTPLVLRIEITIVVILKLSNLLRGSLRQYSNCIQEKNSQKHSRAPVEGVILFFFLPSLLPYFLTDLLISRVTKARTTSLTV